MSDAVARRAIAEGVWPLLESRWRLVPRVEDMAAIRGEGLTPIVSECSGSGLCLESRSTLALR